MLSMTFLTDDERAYLKAQHKRERDRRICDRIKAVLLFDRGWSAASIAEALLLSEDAIRDHISEYKGSKKLKPESGGSIEKLSAEQSRQLEEYLQYHTYLYVKDISHHVIIQEDEMLNAEATIKFFQTQLFSAKGSGSSTLLLRAGDIISYKSYCQSMTFLFTNKENFNKKYIIQFAY